MKTRMVGLLLGVVMLVWVVSSVGETVAAAPKRVQQYSQVVLHVEGMI